MARLSSSASRKNGSPPSLEYALWPLNLPSCYSGDGINPSQPLSVRIPIRISVRLPHIYRPIPSLFMLAIFEKFFLRNASLTIVSQPMCSLAVSPLTFACVANFHDLCVPAWRVIFSKRVIPMPAFPLSRPRRRYRVGQETRWLCLDLRRQYPSATYWLSWFTCRCNTCCSWLVDQAYHPHCLGLHIPHVLERRGSTTQQRSILGSFH
jgi:hypothetical protein